MTNTFIINYPTGLACISKTRRYRAFSASSILLVVIAILGINSRVLAGSADVLTSRNDKERTGAYLSERILNPNNVNPNDFGRLFHYDLSFNGVAGGHVYAQPLYVSNIRVAENGLVNLVIVAATNNFVFAFDADGPMPGSDGIIWKRNLGQAPKMDKVWELGCTRTWKCGIPPPGGNIESNTNVGIMSTPVIDRERDIIFVVNRILADSEHIIYQLHALDLRSGNERAGSPIEIKASTSGLVFDPITHNQRPGLALANNQVIIAWGAHEDLMNYQGWIMSYRYDDANSNFIQTGVRVTTPDGVTERDCASNKDIPSQCAHGGIWMSGRAPAVDAEGNVLLFVGNGKNDMSSPVVRNYGNSFLKLDPVSLRVVDFFTPYNHLFLNATDLDFGGSGPVILTGSNLIVGGGKEGVMHVWRNDNLGRFAVGDPFVVQKFDIGPRMEHKDVGMDTPGGVVLNTIKNSHPGHIMGGPVYWPRADKTSGSRLFHWGENANLTSYKVDSSASKPISSPLSIGPDFQEGHPGGILSLSAAGDDLASGIVWAATYDASNTYNVFLDKVGGAFIKVVPGTLRAYAAENLRPLWTSEANPDDRLGLYAKFIPPTIANGRVYMVTFSNQLVVYGLRKHKYFRPAAKLGSFIPVLNLLLQEDE